MYEFYNIDVKLLLKNSIRTIEINVNKYKCVYF